jgi:SNF2 family DNA or RNA helicase
MRTPVRSLAEGTVIQLGCDSDYGKYVLIFHGNAWSTVYAHLSLQSVSVGDRLKAYLIGAHQHSRSRHRLISPFLLRRTKAEVAKELPERTEVVLASELSAGQRKLYEAEKKKAQAFLLRAVKEGEFTKLRFHVLASLLKLRQICCHPGLISEDAHNEDSGKLLQLRELLEEIITTGNRVLVFSQFVSFLDLARRLCEQAKWEYSYLDGRIKDRAKLVERFQAGNGGQIFLILLKAGGVGFNLTAASYVILLDPWWNPAAENQAIDRTHRIGQTVPVTAYRLIARDTIEEKVLALQHKKAAFISALIKEGDTETALTLDDLQTLLE